MCCRSGPVETFDTSSTLPRTLIQQGKKKPCESIRKAITPGGVAGLQTRWGTASVPG
ncbi:conserved protein of unknown function [Ectopseudomonas oleovorans]|uniref:Uncharacterized protein n=1 Tax=Ectopseudomonas oleovorans TaxID=301 RepID=A0A653B6E9_ECTOL|nr:conserved protein of unknown function [Pseudomonas oleovorans]